MHGCEGWKYYVWMNMKIDEWIMMIACRFIVSEARAYELKLMMEFNRNYGKWHRVGNLIGNIGIIIKFDVLIWATFYDSIIVIKKKKLLRMCLLIRNLRFSWDFSF